MEPGRTVGVALETRLIEFQASAERDEATGLAQIGARWYDPRMGRFLSEDPGSVTGDVHPNPFEYAGNDPIDNTDPTGLSIKPPTFSLPKFNAAPSFSNQSFTASLPRFNAFDPIGSTRSYSGVSYASPKSSLSSGTLFNTAANVFSTTASSFVSPLAKSAFGTGVSLVGAAATQVVPYIGRNEEQSSASFFNPFSYYYSGYSGLSKHAELDRQIAANQLKEVMKQGGFDEIEALQRLHHNQGTNATTDATQLANTAVEFNAVALSGGFLRPGAADTGGSYGSAAPRSSSNPYIAEEIPLAGTRNTGVARAKALEVELVQKTGSGTVNWTQEEIQLIKRTGQLPTGTTGHHVNSVNEFPEWAGDPRNIKLVRGQAENLAEHGGNFQNSTTGPLIDRQTLIQQGAKGKR
jgi:RHS repeat-associated protein